MTAQPSSQAEREDVAREVDRLSYLLFETWKRVDPHSGVAKHPVSYIANFADMARAVIADREPATPRSMPEEVAADLLDQYADFIRRDVKADDLERHPYLPLIEQTVTDLRALIPGASA